MIQLRKQLAIGALIVFSGSAALGQPKAYMEPRKGFFSGPAKVVVNGKPLTAGFFVAGRYKIADEMKDNSEAFQYALKHECYSKWSTGFLWGGLGAALIYLNVTDRDDFRDGAYWGILGAGLITSVVYRNSAGRNLHRAINSYNGVKTSAEPRVKYYVDPLPDGAAAAASLSY